MNISISNCFIFFFIPLSKAFTFVTIEPNGGNITICQDKITDIEYKVSSESIIGQFYQTLNPETWYNCDDCQIWFMNDTRLSQRLHKTNNFESLIKIDRLIIEEYAKQNIDKDLPIRRLLAFPERSKNISLYGYYGYYGACYYNTNLKANATCDNLLIANGPVLDEGKLYCMTDLGNTVIHCINIKGDFNKTRMEFYGVKLV